MLNKILQDFDNRHARCIATDSEYTDKEMVEILSNALKRNYEEDRKSLFSTAQAVVEEIRGRMPEDIKSPSQKCLNLEQHLFGICFQCQKNKGYNLALSDTISTLSQISKELQAKE